MMFPWWVVGGAFCVGFAIGVMLVSMLAVAHHADACAVCARETA